MDSATSQSAKQPSEESAKQPASSTNATTTSDTENLSSKQMDTLNNDDNSDNYDIVLFGATSFVGKLTAQYLMQFFDAKYSSHANQSIRWAIAGRNERKLQDVKRDLNAPDLPILIANSEDADSLNHLCAHAKVVISTVGPYLKYGEKLIQACVAHGTDYVDLTGESIFIKKMMDTYSEDAKKSGARIVNSCGFDSIPSDLGVLYTQTQAQKAFGERCSTIHMRVKAAKGGMSGGTIASMATIFSEVAKDKNLRKQITNPYLLNDDDNAPTVRQMAIRRPKFDAEHNRWLAPFIMETINTRIVHRTNLLTDYAYGRDFKYDEAMWTPAGLKGQAMSYAITAGMAGFAAGMSFDKTRELLNDKILPKPGSGPSKKERDNGYFDIRFFGTTDSGKQLETKVTGDKDPGYGSTCQMLAQSALCLLQDVSKDDISGGFWTPASAMGEKLLRRLEKHAGLTFTTL